jgi:hypothetical protein
MWPWFVAGVWVSAALGWGLWFAERAARCDAERRLAAEQQRSAWYGAELRRLTAPQAPRVPVPDAAEAWLVREAARIVEREGF